MKLFVKGLEAPEPPYKCDLTCFVVESVPFALAGLEYRIASYVWASDEDAYRGEQMLRELQVGLLTGCLDELLEINRQVYRLIDAGMFGRQYEVISEEPLIIEPPIPAVPTLSVTGDGLIGQVDELRMMLNNLLDGKLNAPRGYTDPRGVKQRLQEILEAIEASEDKTELMELLGKILLAFA